METDMLIARWLVKRLVSDGLVPAETAQKILSEYTVRSESNSSKENYDEAA